MQKLAAADLLPLERYARERAAFRARILEHKRDRQVAVGPNTRWCFEDRLTIQYQIQEMLRVERIFEPAGIEEELAAYNPLIPDGRNLKATLLIEFPDEAERRIQLGRLLGIEGRCWIQVGEHPRVYAIADEDLERATDAKTSSVHFLRFELAEAMARDLKGGAPLALGIDHQAYRHHVAPAPEPIRAALAADLA